MKVIAVEENSSAFITLNQLKLQKGWKDILQVCSSIGTLSPQTQADIIVLELRDMDSLLYPERLDMVQQYLRTGGVCIPSSCAYHLSPIQSPSLYSQVRSLAESQGHHSVFERLYSVSLRVR